MRTNQFKKAFRKTLIKAKNKTRNKDLHQKEEHAEILHSFLEKYSDPIKPIRPVSVVEQILGHKVSPFPLQAICDATEAFERLIGLDITKEYVRQWLNVSAYFHDVVKQLPMKTFESDENPMVDEMTKYLTGPDRDRTQTFIEAMKIFVAGAQRAIGEYNWECFSVLDKAMLPYAIVLTSIEKENK